MWWIPFLSLLAIANCDPEFQTLFSWKQLDFDCQKDVQCQKFLEDNEKFIPLNNVLDGMAVWKDKMFLTVGRWNKGVASNLNYVKISDINSIDQKSSPKLIPYPSWEENDMEDISEDTIIDMIHLKIDSNNRLWGLDNGMLNVVEEIRKRPARLIAIDLETNKISVKYELKDVDVKNNSLFSNVVIDDKEGDLENVYAYIFDPIAGGLVVYDHKNKQSWRVEHESFKHDSINGTDAFHLCELELPLVAGINDGFLLRNPEGNSETLYFHALSSTKEFKVATNVLKNKELAEKVGDEIFEVGSKGNSSQAPTSALDESTGISYFSQYEKNGISCWDTDETLSEKTFRLVPGYKPKSADLKEKDLAFSSNRENIYVLTGNVGQIPCGTVYDENHFIAYAPLENVSKFCKAD